MSYLHEAVEGSVRKAVRRWPVAIIKAVANPDNERLVFPPLLLEKDARDWRGV